ncbi:hypothetical protein CSA57_10850 [candidate division KSB3 bacterium]|nr:MAG: hypothetical protein CSA57_10850 [candidate division KSB3 bacterium]
MSEDDRRTGVKKLRGAVSFAAVLKARGVNMRRAALCRKRRSRRKTAPFGPGYVIVLAFEGSKIISCQWRRNDYRTLSVAWRGTASGFRLSASLFLNSELRSAMYRRISHNALFGAEGLFVTKLTGPGCVYLQNLPRLVETMAG